MTAQNEAKPTVEDGTTKFCLSVRGATNFVQDDPWVPMEKALSNPWSPENKSGMSVECFMSWISPLIVPLLTKRTGSSCDSPRIR